MLSNTSRAFKEKGEPWLLPLPLLPPRGSLL